ncbi:hypothetical protein ACFU6R_11995 [Streptomyces sp. NPDC057499]|uniref:hypothetical protein n=1 Tax=Streptomyces sp. NPDC057499 TaxID=3346150 RepID=UPI0036B8BA48
MPIWAGILTGAVIGVVLVALAPAVLVIGVVLMRDLAVPPEPDGAPVALSSDELTGTWQDDRGGILVLAADGTFSSTQVCGDYVDFDNNLRSGYDFPSRLSASGKWDADDSTNEEGATSVDLDFTYGDGEISGFYDARSGGDAPVLWTYVGDPDDGKLCVLEKADRPADRPTD